jgi:hypothetical protein
VPRFATRSTTDPLDGSRAVAEERGLDGQDHQGLRCRDVFELADGKIKRFDCYPEGSVILTQLGVIGNLSSALE